MKTFLSNSRDAWINYSVTEKIGVGLVLFLAFMLLVACIVFPVLIVFLAILAAIVVVCAFFFFGLITIMERFI